MERKKILTAYYHDYRNRLDRILDQVRIDDLEKVVSTIIETFKSGNTLYICGNGGSAATASHMQSDFSF